MRIYVAGRMTSQPLYGYAEFMQAKARWMQLGHQVKTPFDGNNLVWRQYFGRDFDPSKDSCEYGSQIMLDFWREDTNILLWSDALALLPHWEDSRGSRIEVQEALLLDKRLFNAFTLEEIHLKVTVSFNTE